MSNQWPYFDLNVMLSRFPHQKGYGPLNTRSQPKTPAGYSASLFNNTFSGLGRRAYGTQAGICRADMVCTGQEAREVGTQFERGLERVKGEEEGFRRFCPGALYSLTGPRVGRGSH